MRNVGLLIILSVFSTVQTYSPYDAFVERWELDKNQDLNCIHRTIEKLGSNPKPRPGDPVFQGSRTTCFFLQEGAHQVWVYKWPAMEKLLAVYFVRGRPPYTPVLKEGDYVRECQTMSDMDSSNQPQWIKSKNTRELKEKLKTHCFFKKIKQAATYKYVFKVSYYPQKNGNSEYFESKRIFFLVPNKENYYIVNNEDALEGVCTRCLAGGGFSQTPLVKGNNITELLGKASQELFG